MWFYFLDAFSLYVVPGLSFIMPDRPRLDLTLTVAIYLVLFVLILVYLVLYLPQHVVVMQRRAVYYLWGVEGDEKVWW